MATIEICNYLDAFKKTNHSATSFQFYDADADKVLDQNLNDTVNLYSWTSELKDGKGGHYRNIKNMIGRVKFHYGKEITNWITVGIPYDQTAHPQIVHQCEINLLGEDNG